jgi:hypothetical protein
VRFSFAPEKLGGLPGRSSVLRGLVRRFQKAAISFEQGYELPIPARYRGCLISKHDRLPIVEEDAAFEVVADGAG